MNTHENIPWEAIAAYLKKEADQQQKQTIEDWLKASDDHPALLDEIISSWQISRGSLNTYQPNTEELWNKLVARIDKQQHPGKTRMLSLRQWVAAAAILVLVFLTGTWTSYLFQHQQTTVLSKIVVPPGSRTQTILPDGTKVWLNSGAELRYPTNFAADHREVYSSGECYFEVAKDKKHRFIVHCADLSVQVFGTSFNIRENSRDKSTIVSLIEGSVKVLDNNEQIIASLSPGQQLIMANGKGTLLDVENIATLTSWIRNSLSFENNSLTEVVRSLESWYGVRIELDPQMPRDHRYTFKIKTESLREVLNLISVITPINYKIEGENVKISYK